MLIILNHRAAKISGWLKKEPLWPDADGKSMPPLELYHRHPCPALGMGTTSLSTAPRRQHFPKDQGDFRGPIPIFPCNFQSKFHWFLIKPPTHQDYCILGVYTFALTLDPQFLFPCRWWGGRRWSGGSKGFIWEDMRAFSYLFGTKQFKYYFRVLPAGHTSLVEGVHTHGRGLEQNYF